MDSYLKQPRISFPGLDEDGDYNVENRQRKTGSSTRGDNSLRNPSTSDKTKEVNMTYEIKVSVEKVPEKMPGAKSIKKTATFADKYPRKMDSVRSENEEDDKGGRSTSLSTKPVNSNKNSHVGPGNFISEAEAWEKKEMEKIRNKYEKTNRKLLEWENEKKIKAKRRLDRKEGDLEERRARAQQEYRTELMKIDKIAGGDRAHAEERKRNDESKILEKANKMKATGRLPSACPCF